MPTRSKGSGVQPAEPGRENVKQSLGISIPCKGGPGTVELYVSVLSTQSDTLGISCWTCGRKQILNKG